MSLKIKNVLTVPLLSLFLGTGCVMTPTGDIVTAPVDVGADVAIGSEGVGIEPRIHIGSRSAVTVWLHPNYYVYDAYPVAQRHCARWGMFARPRRDWSYNARAARYLDYTCVRNRPTLAYPHFRRGHRYHHVPGRRTRYDRPHRRGRRIYTPKPRPRVQPPRRRGTFGRIHNPPTAPKRGVVVERGKPWEHNGKKKKIGSFPTRPKKNIVVERGKPWEHNRNKNREPVYKTPKKPAYSAPKKTFKRTTFGSLKKKPKVIEKGKSVKYNKYGSLKKKKAPVRRKTLSL